MNKREFGVILATTGEVGTVVQVHGAIAIVRGLPLASPGELVIFEAGQQGFVFSLTMMAVEVLLLSVKIPIQVGMKAARSGSPLRVAAGEGLLGKTVNALGNSWETNVPIAKLTEEREIDAEVPSLTERRLIQEPFESGVSMVDLVVPLSLGQRELVIGDHKIGKTSFLLQSSLTHVAKGGVVVYCGIAKRVTEIATFKKFFYDQRILEASVLVFSSAADAPGMVYLTPYTAMSIAEFFKDQGKNVLIIFDDLTIHAKYYREISLLDKRYPGRSAYPGDIFSIHAKLLERAGNFAKGSITAMPVAETVMGDITGYIQTNLMSMTDGHIFFDIELFNQGKRPAVNPFLSVTRVGHQTQTPLLRDLSRKLSGFLVEVTKLKELLHFGGELTDRVRKGLIKGSMVDAIFSQGDSLVVPLPISAMLVALVFAEMGGDTPDNIATIRSQLMMAYGGDLGWKDYIDKLFTMTTFDDLVAKLAQDRQLLTPLLTVKRG